MRAAICRLHATTTPYPLQASNYKVELAVQRGDELDVAVSAAMREWEQQLVRNDSAKLSPVLQAYYWGRVKELCDLRKQHPDFKSLYAFKKAPLRICVSR